MFGLWRRYRRRRLRERPFPDEWRAHLRHRVPFYSRLPAELQPRFEDMLKVFAWEKHVEGARGMEITDEVRTVVAAAAVRLVLHLDLSYYDRLTEIVVYADDYRHPDRDGVILGEAHSFGTVVLSWAATLRGLRDPFDGHDTATHEFAHVLDALDGSFDGAPVLRGSGAYAPWARVMQRHFDSLVREDPEERRVLRDYGATSPAEFFAVATETFFEKSRQMKTRLPELYRELEAFYGFDPAADDLEGVPSGRAIGRNEPCPCGRGRKYKRCCGRSR